ncbi:vWA domain-containing protein [Phreatobacter sp. AB_2022a]|uniref:vWA domain-containing protein n=1 Tax=Phreatobacter sp. AB_2022a TaxID=3003134 RepID=UPI0022872CF9|nr:TadE/TadG family type IV pilus assembly protein [Phreatobacter sp. AB_2022a]MCZ0738735.1 TadE/TadG family protein [Phreatobacter sp. AB_2022a]
MSSLIRKFRGDRRGTVAVVLAIAIYPIMVMVIAAVDITRVSEAETRLHAAVDIAALTVARQLADGKLTGDPTPTARAIVEANLGVSSLTNLQVSARIDGPAVTVDGSGQLALTSSLMNSGPATVAATASAIWRTKKIDLVLVLDNTGSMASAGKMDALKAAATNLVNTLSRAAPNRPDAVRVGIVPFDTQVNVGTGYRDESWLRFSGTTTASSWTGCVIDRNQPYDTDDTVPSGSDTAFPARNCSTGKLATILPLTTDWTALTNKIAAMNPSGNTNVTIGLAWGLHMLTPAQPLTNARTVAQEPELERIIILLTDGDNTQNRWSTSGTEIDARTDAACANVKANGIRLYTIRVIDGDAALLRRCASQTTMYYSVAQASELGPVFQRIATEITQLRLTQ